MNISTTKHIPAWQPEPHTPGPWQEFAESGDYWIAQIIDDGMPGDTICNSNDISEGNVNLICSAPGLSAKVQSLRLQLAACHEAIGSALALLRQEQTSAAMLVLDDALKGTRR